MLNVYIVGVGGQGVLTVAELIARAAQNKGYNCNFYPTKGMAQRGGFVKAQLRIGASEDMGPDIAPGTADVALSMELSETLKLIPYIKHDGDLLIWAHKWLPTDVMLGRAPYPSVEDVVSAARERGINVKLFLPEEFESDMVDNMFVLGALQSNTGLGSIFTAKELEDAMLSRFPRGRERNMNAFECGVSAQTSTHGGC